MVEISINIGYFLMDVPGLWLQKWFTLQKHQILSFKDTLW